MAFTASWPKVGLCKLRPRSGRSPSPDSLRHWAKARLAGYKVPRRFLETNSLPRNLMGKINKPAVAKRFPSPGKPAG